MRRRTDRSWMQGAGGAASLALCLAAGTAAGAADPPWAAPPAQAEAYMADRAKSVLDLQPFRTEATAPLPGGGTLRLIDLNPRANAWFLLELGGDAYHIENPDPRGQSVALSPGPPAVLALRGARGASDCAPWADKAAELTRARKSGSPYAPLCGGRLLLRNPVVGARTNLEKVAEFLRDKVWGGEQIVSFVRESFFRDSFAESGKEVPAGRVSSAPDGPAPAALDPAWEGLAVAPEDFGLGLASPGSRGMALGLWYRVAAQPGVFASLIQPEAVAQDILESPGAARLDSVERGALDYMIAFDLSQYDLGFELGTDHPRLGWSPRASDAMRAGGLPGPDGIDSRKPLVTTGMVSPALAGRVAAAFTGGFKREHGAFRYGPLSAKNRASHYGFIEQGVILSKLQPELSTIYVLDDGTVGMKTWTAADDRLLPRIRFARQNGVPLIEAVPGGGPGVPGEFVTKWGAGNWSGSAKKELRTLRAGACMAEGGGRRFLVYGYFSTATPSAMARTFQAYGCRYAMLLDMNALEHTYLALYSRRGGVVGVEHLIPGMSVVDRTAKGGALVPRFLAFPDNRDFFYLIRKEGDR